MNKYNKLNLKKIFNKIYLLKISDVLVEAGGILFTNLIKNKLVDEIYIFKSKIIIGDYGKPAIWGKKINDLNFSLIKKKKFKDDIFYNYKAH